MKRNFLILILLLCMMAAFGQKPSQAKKDSSQMARITFEKTLHDFGTIQREGSVTYAFKFTNTGKSPLVLSKVDPRCDCTVAKWSKEPVKPGQAGQITIKYTPDHRGDFFQDITVTSNAVNPSVEIYVKGVIK